MNRRGFSSLFLASGLAPAGLHTADRDGPGPLNAHAACRSPDLRATLLYGGADAGRVRDDLWRLDDDGWRRAPGSAPGPRTFPACAWDTRRSRMVVFGGNRGLFGSGGDALLDDHWEWDGRSWRTDLGPRPPSRSEAACAFDEARGVTVLFGGYRFQDGVRVRLDDLWEHDGSAWRRRAVSGPDARSGAVFVYDASRGRCLLIGGNGPRSDVWALNGEGWRRLGDMPLGRSNPAAAFEPGGNRLVVFGGWNGVERIAATSLYDGVDWSLFEGLQHSPRNHAPLISGPGGRDLMLIGGHTGDHVLGDIWSWADSWRSLKARPPVRRIDNGH